MNVPERLRTPPLRSERRRPVSGHLDPRKSQPRSSRVDKIPAMTTRTATRELTSAEVCQRTGLTYRQLDYWTRTGRIASIVDEVGSGAVRSYAPTVVREIRSLLRRIDACPMHGPGHS